jgi:hypothetical protein
MPYPPHQNGTGNRPTRCAGCEVGFVKGDVILRCHFAHKPFMLKGAAGGVPGPRMCVPCQTRYHVNCFRLTKPFLSRLADEGGLRMPPSIASILPVFICECCTVRAFLGKELTWHPRERALMMLERMRILDMVHQWAPGTIDQYKGKIRLIRQFEQTFQCKVLREPELAAPICIEAVPLMWAQQFYSLQQRKWHRGTAVLTPDEDRVSYGTVRTMRSAASLYHTWLTMVEHPGQVVREHGSQRPIQVDGCIPTDGLEYSLMSAGMSRRLGESATPAVALLDRHIRSIDSYLDNAYTAAMTVGNQLLAGELARAGGCNLTAWLAWLQGGETFGIRWNNLTAVLPGDGASQDLPPEVGAILVQLLLQTKTCRSSQADIAIAFCTGSGLNLGKWLLRIRQSTPQAGMAQEDWATDSRFVFNHDDGRPWDSAYFRHNYLIPLLHAQRLNGDPYLREYDGSPGKSLAEVFYSMHSYRRGARSHVSQRRPLCVRKATPEEVNEHGRWRRQRQSEPMAEQYRQWGLADRLAVTLLCM